MPMITRMIVKEEDAIYHFRGGNLYNLQKPVEHTTHWCPDRRTPCFGLLL